MRDPLFPDITLTPPQPPDSTNPVRCVRLEVGHGLQEFPGPGRNRGSHNPVERSGRGRPARHGPASARGPPRKGTAHRRYLLGHGRSAGRGRRGHRRRPGVLYGAACRSRRARRTCLRRGHQLVSAEVAAIPHRPGGTEERRGGGGRRLGSASARRRARRGAHRQRLPRDDRTSGDARTDQESVETRRTPGDRRADFTRTTGRDAPGTGEAARDRARVRSAGCPKCRL